MSYKQKPKEMPPHFCFYSCFLPLPQRKISKSAYWRWKTHWLNSGHPICPGLDHLRSEYNQPRQQSCQLPRLQNLSHSNFWSCSCWKPTHQPVNQPTHSFFDNSIRSEINEIAPNIIVKVMSLLHSLGWLPMTWFLLFTVNFWVFILYWSIID